VKPGLAAGLLWLLGLAGCCIEESPAILYLPTWMSADLAEACLVSPNDHESDTAIDALADYLSHLTYRPSNKRQCVLLNGTACQLDYPCDEPPDLGHCPEPVIPKRRYRACFGCGAEGRGGYARMKLRPKTYGLLERVQRESGSATREEALHKAILYYRDLWRKKRQDPNFYKDPNNLPHFRKPNEPCPWLAELQRRMKEADFRRKDGGAAQ
jgi:hypothetical protein